MSNKRFRAYRVERGAQEQYTRGIQTLSIDDLPAGDVLVRVHYSSLNYKDALSASGAKGITRDYPHTPGIDCAGIVEESTSSNWQVGDEVIVTGYDLGMNTAGGFAGYVRVPAEWVLRCPKGLTLRQAMICGTAGFTAALCIQALEERGVHPGGGEVLVTGASGGVGSVAVSLLNVRGYRVVAATGKRDAMDWLRGLGADEVIPREALIDHSARPLLKARWMAAVDTVGGEILATTLKAMVYQGAVSCCGMVASAELHTTVFPFILRAVSLLGVDSQNAPRKLRELIWAKLAGDWQGERFEAIATEITLDQVGEHLERLLSGQVRGRILLNPRA
ncbi:YhdH/YhfP family quinone oxidoreductase [Nitrococcus mobilis]|uniref:Oxidoreductase n=1 Tax=Nitrococcus mobilis Nb-231 TaxID=314278 RepID=A4BPZ1_9GAMM|nr:YhdH/YhfP family quinone oxidoreductase [Nitrococcus mobilis]EAR22146.1 oxidoreductase [Nitrococcus mobilis Nb-231]